MKTIAKIIFSLVIFLLFTGFFVKSSYAACSGSGYNTCSQCTSHTGCGWNGVINICQSGTAACPAGLNHWHYGGDCVTNLCTGSPTATPPVSTPTPTTPPSGCSSQYDCYNCINEPSWTCGWGKRTGYEYSCESKPNQNSCPAGYTEWYWTDCSAFGNLCSGSPTPTPTTAPVPGRVYNGTSTVINSTSAYVRWDAVTGATSYRVYYEKQIEDPNWLAVNGISTNSYTFPDNLTSNTVYLWKVKACNLNGCSVDSTIWNFTTQTPSCSASFINITPAAGRITGPNKTVTATYKVTTNDTGVYTTRGMNGAKCTVAGCAYDVGALTVSPASLALSGLTSYNPTFTVKSNNDPDFATKYALQSIQVKPVIYSGVAIMCSGTLTVNIVGPTATPRPPTATPIPPTYSIRGNVFNDADGNRKKGTGESFYPGTMVITRSPSLGNYSGPTATTGTTNGNYSFTNLPARSYTVTFSEPLSAGYSFTYPLALPLRSLTVTVGPSCTPVGIEPTVCSSGNVSNLNAGVTITKDPWFQSVGSDIRWDSGKFDAPSVPVGKYISDIGLGGMPGIIFSGGKTGLTPCFGSTCIQNPSTKKWQVGAGSYTEVFTDTHSVIPTSYNFLLETALGSGITPSTTLSSPLPNFIPNHNIYKIAGNLTVSALGVTFGSGNFVILVDGNLTINGNIIVPAGSTVIFSVKGDITIDKSVTSIDGLYSADKNFTVNGDTTCPPYNQLKINGSVIVNAGRSGGIFTNNRTLCGDNSTTPSVQFIERPDFMLNYPSMVTQTTRSWQDTPP